MKCSKIGAQLPDYALFCDKCGQKVEPKKESVQQSGTKFCKHFGQPMPIEAMFCPNCGGKQSVSSNAKVTPSALPNTNANTNPNVNSSTTRNATSNYTNHTSTSVNSISQQNA